MDEQLERLRKLVEHKQKALDLDLKDEVALIQALIEEQTSEIKWDE